MFLADSEHAELWKHNRKFKHKEKAGIKATSLAANIMRDILQMRFLQRNICDY